MSALINVDKFVRSALFCYDSKVLKGPWGDIFCGSRSQMVIQSVNIYHLTLLEN